VLKGMDEKMGPFAIRVNKAGITRDAMLHKLSPEQWSEDIATNLG